MLQLPVGTYSLGKVSVAYEINIHVFPTVPSLYNTYKDTPIPNSDTLNTFHFQSEINLLYLTRKGITELDHFVYNMAKSVPISLIQLVYSHILNVPYNSMISFLYFYK